MYRKGKGKISDMTCRPSNFQDVVDEMNRLLLLNDSDEEIRLEESSTVHGDSAVATTPELPFFAVMTEKKKTNNGKIEESTEASFDETMKAGSNLADGILKEVQKKTEKSKIKEGAKEKSPWFPFTF